MANTIVAIATAHGVGSIAIVRLSGDDAVSIALTLTNSKSLTPRYAHLKTLKKSDDTIIDEAIVLFFEGPHSFTGEDVVEFQCHGGVVVASILLDELLHLGASLATPGEFSKRAFINGRIDLTQAEAIASLIDAKSEDAAQILAKQMKGDLKNFIEEVRDELLLLIAYSEVTIDYAEEDLPQDLIDQMQVKLEKIAVTLSKSAQASKQRMVLIDGYKVAIIGRPNVGKSSLLNALLHYDRAIVSDIAGTTRDTIEESIKIGTHLIRIIDTAGIRDASDTIERIGIEKSLSAVSEADIVIALFDASQELTEDDKAILDIVKKADKKSLIVLNKIDLETKIDKSLFLESNSLEISCKGDTKNLIEALSLLMDEGNQTQDNTLISKRQILAVEKSVQEINLALDPLSDNELEIFSFHLNEAITQIASITRPMEYDEMLDKMFGSFCLGK
jgi:tRNA modification GTPase